MREPYYTIDFSVSACMFEIRVNDYPVITMNVEGQTGTNIPINFAILESGLQSISATMLPNIGDTQLDSKAGLKFDIKLFDVAHEFAFQNQFGNYQSDLIGNKKLPIISYTNTFQALVPYMLIPVDESEKLFTKDSEKLKNITKEVVLKYNEIRNLYLHKNAQKDDIVDLYYEREKRYAQQMYLTKEAIKEDWDTQTVFKTDPGITFFDLKPIEDYDIVFYGEGRLVSLVRKINKESALWGGITQNDVNSTIHIPILLHRPKGSKELVVY